MEETEQTMTSEEMQRFLNLEAKRGTTKTEAIDALLYILGVQWPGEDQAKFVEKQAISEEQCSNNRQAGQHK